MSIPRKHIDWKRYDEFDGTDAAFARSIGMDPRNFWQYKKTRWRDEPTENSDRPDAPPVETTDLTPPVNEPEPATTSLQRVEIMGEPVSSESSAVPHIDAQDYAELRSRVDALEAHRLEVDAWLATLQAQVRETAQPCAELRSTDMRSDAQESAEPTWDDPDDAKPVPFNLSMPRGLKRWLEAEAKRTGLPASRLVQRWILAQRNGKGVQNA